MKKFEYKIHRVRKSMQEELTNLGNEGWELCVVNEVKHFTFLILKRELGEIDVLKEILRKRREEVPDKPIPPTGTVFTEGVFKSIKPKPPKNRISKDGKPNIWEEE